MINNKYKSMVFINTSRVFTILEWECMYASYYGYAYENLTQFHYQHAML